MERLSMRKIREVLRLTWEAGLSARQIAESLQLARSTVGECLRRFRESGLPWPLPSELGDVALEQRLFPPPVRGLDRTRPRPDWARVHQELKRKGVTLALLWQEYKLTHPDGYQYSRFCDQYRAWVGRQDVVMRQTHRVGEKLFVDYTGQPAEVIDRTTGEIRLAQVFVAVLGASNYTYAEATWTQQLPDWIGAHVRAFAFFGGVPEVLVPDNLKSGVTKAHRYEPDLNPTYADLAQHYGVAVLPARSRKPRDKAKVEVGVQIVERWILAALRHRQCFSLAELNQAIRTLLLRLNQRPFKKQPDSRQTLFITQEQPALRPLPLIPYEFAEWKKARVHIDYHVEIEGHYYSVPYRLVRAQVDVRLTARTVECFHQGQRVASHLRSPQRGQHTTVVEHMPVAHREHAEWTPQRLLHWAESIGPATTGVIQTLFERRTYPQHAFRAALGILRLAKGFGTARLEAASQRALRLGACSYKSLDSILKQGLDQQPLPTPTPTAPVIDHDNLRGAAYYH
jgi:transposase